MGDGRAGPPAVACCVEAGLAATNWGFAGWLNDFQASFRGGECDVGLTIAILMLPCVSFCWWLGMTFDRVTGRQEFERIGELIGDEPRSEMRSFAEIEETLE